MLILLLGKRQEKHERYESDFMIYFIDCDPIKM